MIIVDFIYLLQFGENKGFYFLGESTGEEKHYFVFFLYVHWQLFFNTIATMSTKKIILFISIGLNILFIGLSIKLYSTFKEDLSQYLIRKNKSADIIMLGDSHTMRGQWIPAIILRQIALRRLTPSR